MPQSVVNPPQDRVEGIEQEIVRLKSELKQTTRQLSFLQVLFLLFAAGVGGGGYYLAKEGMLRIEGFSPPVAKTVESKDFGFYNRANTRTWFATDDKFGDPQIIFLNPKKQLKMRLKVWPEEEGGGGLALYDVNGWRGEFRMDGDGASMLNLRGDKQQGGMDVKVAHDGSSSLKMFGKAGAGKGGIDLKVDSEGNPSLVVTDTNGATIWRLPASPK